MRTLAMMAWCGLALSSGTVAQAQERREPIVRAYSYITGDVDRPRLGLTTRSTGERDTLGLLVESVTREGPADRAGIEEGDRLVAINSVNLRLSASDAGAPEMASIPHRRLVRELERHEPGDTVTLQVYRDGQTRTVRVRTASAEELSDRWFVRPGSAALRNRAALGISLGGSGSARDTMGILVVGVTDGGPADSAGIDEGDRLAAINGVDLRVAREDAGDWVATNARIRRLQRELENVEPGQEVELRVVTAGQSRTVRVRAARASELRNTSGGAFYWGDGPGRILESLRGLPQIRIFPDAQRRVEVERVLEQSRRAIEEAMSRTREARERAADARAAAERRAVDAQLEAWSRSRAAQLDAMRRAGEVRQRLIEQLRDVAPSLRFDLDGAVRSDQRRPPATVRVRSNVSVL